VSHRPVFAVRVHHPARRAVACQNVFRWQPAMQRACAETQAQEARNHPHLRRIGSSLVGRRERSGRKAGAPAGLIRCQDRRLPTSFSPRRLSSALAIAAG
jgi:hypothetical protein